MVTYSHILWSAVWLMPEGGNRTIWPPEIDLAEFMGGRPRWAFMNYHYTTPSNPHGQASKNFQGPDFAGEFHTFGLEWTPKSLTWYIDGVQRYQVNQNIPALPMYVIANLAVGDWAGTPDKSTPFPSRFLIDYIRVWQSPAS
jgi:beta-glucanase (GH16 family)